VTVIRVEVTAEHIAAAGDDRMAWAQPVEAALAELTGQDVDIDCGGHDDGPWSIATIGQREWTLVVDLHPVAHAWLDARWQQPVNSPDVLEERGEPFAFDLEVPAWLTKLVRPAYLVTLTEASRALGVEAVTLRGAANQLRNGAVSEDGLAGRLAIRRVGRDWLVPLDRLEAEVTRRAVERIVREASK
jgi:hypothetical protein